MARVAVFPGCAVYAVREGSAGPGVCCIAPFAAVCTVLVAVGTVRGVDE